MSAKVGPLSFQAPAPGEMAFDKPYSESTAQLIDQEVCYPLFSLSFWVILVINWYFSSGSGSSQQGFKSYERASIIKATTN